MSGCGQSVRDDGRVATLHQLRFELLVRRRSGRSSASHVGSLSTVWPGFGELLESLAQVHGVADERVLDPLLAAEQGRGDRRRC